jgi:asparagine synthase (glutamine-hydrolysing)
MCGINGVVRTGVDAPPIDMAELRRVRDAMAARGPDGVGEWASDSGACALGHRRLAIIDLSPQAAQPMLSSDGRLAMVFNGEIYNYRELREELCASGAALRTNSDTEAILELFARDGPAAFAKLRGMFALAVWDDRERRLLLVRDGFGIKPLYYAEHQGTLRFASQLKALRVASAVPDALDAGALAGFLMWGSVPEPRTLLRAVRSVPAGHLVEVRDGRVLAPRRWLEPRLEGDPHADGAAAVAASVKAHLVADVEVGVFLSGGLDSSLIAALAQREMLRPLTAVTVRFEEFRGGSRDEGPLAAATARALGMRPVERVFTAGELASLWPRALAAMDQPSIDGFNSYLVGLAAREAGLKVVLSGLGGDELFGSYPSFSDVPRLHSLASRGARVPGLGHAFSLLARLARRPKLAGLVAHGVSLGGAYFLRRALFLPAELPALVGPELAAEGLASYDAVAAADGEAAPASDDAWRAVGRMETALYLRNQLLRDADWASMAHSVETRVPLVDGPLCAAIEGAGFEPLRSRGKAAFVAQAAPELPRELFLRGKTGFGVPDAVGVARGARRPGEASRARALQVLEAFGLHCEGA